MAKAFNLTVQLQLKGPSNVRNIVQQLNSQLKGIQASIDIKVAKNLNANIKSLNQGFNRFNQTLTQTQNVATNAASAMQALASAVRSLQTATNSAQKTNAAIQQTNKTLKEATNQAFAFGKAAGLAFKRYSAFAGITGAIFGLGRAISTGVSDAISFQKELVKLSQISGLGLKQLKGLTDEITRLSIGLGVSSKDLVEVASTLSQAGLSIRDTTKALDALAKSALAPSFDNLNDTVEGSIALMAQFGIKAQDLEKSLGAINKVSADFAVEASDIIAAIKLAGGVFAATSKGVSEGTDALNEFIAVFTSIRATTRESAESIATGLRTIFTRIQRNDTVQALKEYGVVLEDLEGKFVGPYRAVEELARQLNKLDPRDFRFSQIVEELGGYRQIGKVIPLIQQFELRTKALQAAQKGQTSLTEAAETAQLSFANRIAKVREEFTALVREISDTASFKALVDIVLNLSSGLIQLAKTFKEVLPFITAFATIQLTRNAFSIGRGFVNAFKPQGKNDGGQVHRFARGGLVPGSGNTDSVHAMLQPGEFVIRKKAVQALGQDKLFKMNRFATGGEQEDVKKGTGFSPDVITTKLGQFFRGLQTKSDGTYTKSSQRKIDAAGPAAVAVALEIQKEVGTNKTDLFKHLEKLAKTDPVKYAALSGFSAKSETNQANKATIQQTTANQKQIEAENKAKRISGIKNFGVTGATPRFGALILETGPDSFQSDIAYKPKTAAKKQAIANILNKKGDKKLTASNIGSLFTSYSANRIDPSISDTFADEFKTRFTDMTEGIVEQYTGGIPLFKSASGKAARSIEEKLDASVVGFGFEALVAALSDSVLPTNKGFDFPSGNREKLKGLFGNIPDSVKYLDAKKSFDAAFGKSAKSPIPFKAVNQIIQGGVDINTLSGKLPPSQTSPVETTSFVSSERDRIKAERQAQRFAVGGPVGNVPRNVNRNLDVKDPTMTRRSLGLGRSATDILKAGGLRGDETITSASQVRNIANKIASYYKINPGYVKSIYELTPDKIASFKKNVLKDENSKTDVRALFEGTTGNLYFRPGVTNARTIIHELGHAIDRQKAIEIGAAKVKANGETEGVYSSSIKGTPTSVIAKKFAPIRASQLASADKKSIGKGNAPSSVKFIQNRLSRPELLADGFARLAFQDPKLLKGLAGFAKGGSAGTDTVPALLTPGEFVINRKAAQRIGYDRLNKMNQADKYAKGGPVRFAQGGTLAPQSITTSGGTKFNVPGIDDLFRKLESAYAGAADPASEAMVALKQIVEKTANDLEKLGISGKAAERAMRKQIESINKGTVSQLNTAKIYKEAADFQKKQTTKPARKVQAAAVKFGSKLKDAALPAAFLAGPLIQQQLQGSETGRIAGAGISGAFAGAATGASFGPAGALVGGAAGLGFSLVSALEEEAERVRQAGLSKAIEDVTNSLERFAKTGNEKVARFDIERGNVALQNQASLSASSNTDITLANRAETFARGAFLSSPIGFALNKAAQFAPKRIAGFETGIETLDDSKTAFAKNKNAQRDIRIKELTKELQPIAEAKLALASIEKAVEKRGAAALTKEDALNDANVKAFAAGQGGEAGRKVLELIARQTSLNNEVGKTPEDQARIEKEKTEVIEQLNREYDNARIALRELTKAEVEAKETAKKLEAAQIAYESAQLKASIATAKFAATLDKVDAGLARFEAETAAVQGAFSELVTSAGGGRQGLGLNRSAVLDNPLAFSAQERAQRAGEVQRFIGNNNGFAQITAGADSFKAFQEGIRERVTAAAGTSGAFSGDSQKQNIIRFIQSEFEGAGPELVDGMIQSVEQAFSKDTGEKKVEGAALNESIRAITEQFNSLAGRLPEIQAKIEKAFLEANQNLRAGFNAYIDLQLEQNKRFAAASLARDEAINKIKEFRGKELTIADKTRPIQNQVKQLTGGITDPVEIGRQIKAAKGIAARGLEGRTFAPGDLQGEEKNRVKALVDQTRAAEEATEALRILATDVTELTAIEEELAKVRNSKQERRDRILSLRGSSPEENIRRTNIARGIQRGQQFFGQDFNEALQLVKEASAGRSAEEKRTIEDNFLKSQKIDTAALSKEDRESLLSTPSEKEQQLIAKYEGAAQKMSDAGVEYAKLVDPMKVFDTSVKIFQDAAVRLAQSVPQLGSNPVTGPGTTSVPVVPTAPLTPQVPLTRAQKDQNSLNTGGLAGAARQAGVLPPVAAPTQSSISDQVAPFVAAAQSLAQSAELLSKIPTKIEAVMTINPIQVIFNGADVLKTLGPDFEAMAVKLVEQAFSNKFNVDGTIKT